MTLPELQRRVLNVYGFKWMQNGRMISVESMARIQIIRRLTDR